MAISVIIPVYNGSATLNSCLQALTASEPNAYECIVVDDASNDDTLEIAHRFPVRVIQLEGGPFGPGKARNFGAQSATGDILFFVDADVVVHRDTVMRVAETFEENPDVAAVFGSYDDHPRVNDFTSQYKNLFHHFVHQEGQEDAGTFWAGCGAIRREVFLEMGGFDTDRYPRPSIEDIELGYRLRAAGHKIRLNKEIQATHLKRWTLRGLIKTDIFDRGIPWTQLILQETAIPNDLNVQFSQRLSALLLAGMMLHLSLSAFFHNIVLLPLLATLFLVVIGHWTEAGSRGMNRRAEILAYLLTLVIGVVAVYLDLPWMLLPLSLLLAGVLVGRMRILGTSAWGHAPFAITLLGLTASLGFLLGTFPLWVSLPLLVALAFLVLLNLKFYLFFARKRGTAFAVAVVPFHLLYYLYGLLAFALGTGRHLWNDGAKRSA